MSVGVTHDTHGFSYDLNASSWNAGPPRNEAEAWTWNRRAEVAQFATVFAASTLKVMEIWSEQDTALERAKEAVELAVALQAELDRVRPRS